MSDERMQLALARLEASLNALADCHDQFTGGLSAAMQEMKRCLFDLDGDMALPQISDGL